MFTELYNNPWFVLVLIAVFGWVWFQAPKTAFWKKHICDDFPANYPPECFDCNESHCEGCPLNGTFKE
jgi:hypothetical protein